MTDHSILPPSSADMWSKCHGWAIMTQSIPELGESEASRLGTAAHEVAEKFITSYARGGIYNPSIGELTSCGHVIDEAMLDAAEMYADNVRGVMIQTGKFAEPYLGIEHRLTMPEIGPYSYGTSDCFIFDHANRTIYVWDFKYGMDPVPVFENLQLISYVAGVIQHLREFTPFILTQALGYKVVLRVVQPRAFHRDGPIREWQTTIGALLPFFSELREAADANMIGGDTQSGPHCKHCPARIGCQSAISAGVSLYEVASAPIPLELSHDAMATQLALIKRARRQLESMEKALEQQVEHVIKKGARVPGFAVMPKAGRKRWATPVSEVQALGSIFGIELTTTAAVTPRQAEKLGIDPAVIKSYIETPINGVEVVEDDGSKARQIFGA